LDDGRELESPRLRMRQWRQADFPAFAAYYADERTARFVGGVSDAPQAWRRMAALVGHWTLRGFGYWALEEKESGELVGSCGLWLPEGWPELEVGYWLLPAGQGKGYATEAAARAREHAYGPLGATTLVSYIDPGNEPSKRVAQRLGARVEATIDLCGFGPHEVWRHPGPDELA